MRNSTRLVGLGALAALAAIVLAQDTYTLKRVVAVGDSHTFVMNAELDFNGMALTVKAKNVDKVIEVKENGDYAVETTNAEVKVTTPQGDQEFPGGPPATIVYKASGEIAEIKDSAATADTWRLANLMAFRYPTAPVKVGDEWTIDIPADSKTGAVATKANFKIEAVEMVGAINTLKIKANVKETAGDTPAVNDGTMWVSIADGDLVKSNTTWTNVPLPGGMGAVNAKVTITREG